MSRGHNKGSGLHRKRNDWASIARGRANKPRYDRGTVACPHGHHLVAAQRFLTHLNTCTAGLARTGA